jgi:hypothetical protein
MAEIVHGKLSTYSNGKCRCGLCLEANRTYQRNYRKLGRETKKMVSLKDGNRMALFSANELMEVAAAMMKVFLEEFPARTDLSELHREFATELDRRIKREVA